MSKKLPLLLIICLMLSACARPSESPGGAEAAPGSAPASWTGDFFTDGNEMRYVCVAMFDDETRTEVSVTVSSAGENMYSIDIEPTGFIPAERLNLGIFYVSGDFIYKIDSGIASSITDADDAAGRGTLVCGTELSEYTEDGTYHGIIIDGDRCEYASRNTLVETGYYEILAWRRGVGLISYQSGFGAEGNSITLLMDSYFSDRLRRT